MALLNGYSKVVGSCLDMRALDSGIIFSGYAKVQVKCQLIESARAFEKYWKDDMKRQRLLKTVAITLVLVLLYSVARAFTPLVATASHPKGWHLDSIHLSYDYEDFCVNSTGTTQPWRWSDAYTNVSNALWGNSDSAQEWDAKAWDLGGPFWRIWFDGHPSNPCQSLSEAERGPIELEYWIEDDTRYAGPGGAVQPHYCYSGAAPQVSCAAADNPVLYAAGHWNYEFYYLFLYKPYAVGDASADGGANFAWHQVNHETGHALGFDDGAGPGNCPSSVMHSQAYGCAVNLRYPSTGDTNAETGFAFGH